MSLETWKAEFYPVVAEDCPPGQEVEHSLRKWYGLRKEALERHGCQRRSSRIEEGDAVFYVSSETCALCLKHDNTCENCPLDQFLGTTCDQGELDEEGFRKRSVYHSWTMGGDPEPMIVALEKTLAAQRAKAEAAVTAENPITKE